MSRTLSAACAYQEEIRKSRFLAQAAPVSTAAEAQAFIAAHSDASASHNCWAWHVGSHYRSSDDGEPGGTAGRPILAAIQSQGFDQVAVLVTRWYGGIQLGTGGLARAYGGSAAKCLQAGPQRPLLQRLSGYCHLRFAELPLFKAQLASLDGLLQAEHYDGDGARLHLAIPAAQLPTLQQLLADLSRGRVQWQADAGDN